MNKIKELYYRFFKSPEQYLRFIGVTIGKGCFIGTRSVGSEPYLITIGDNVGIASGVYLHTHGGARVARSLYPDFDIFGKIEICNRAYIGSGTHIMPGVTIGENALIAAGSIVTKSVPANEVWGGNPAKRICSVDTYIEKNAKYNLNTKNVSPKEKRRLLLSLPEDKFIKR